MVTQIESPTAGVPADLVAAAMPRWRQRRRASARKAAGAHDVAWLSGEGWFCACPAGARCPAIKAVREALSVAARPTKARKGVAR